MRGSIGENLSYLKSYSGRVLIDAAKQAEVPVPKDGGLFWSVVTRGDQSFNGVYQLSADEPFEVKVAGGSPADIAMHPEPHRYAIGLRSVAGQTAQLHFQFPGRTELPKGVRCIRPGYTVEQADAQVFTTEYIDLLARLNTGVVRDMDWKRTNGSTVTTWDSRCKVTDPLWGVKGKGGPLEPVVALANRLDADLWANIPHMADDDYVRQSAILYRDTLKRRVFVEYSNETWNSAAGFPQGAWMLAQGNALAVTDNAFNAVGPTLRQRYFYAKRAKEIAAIFLDVFKGQEWRVAPLLAGQTGDSSVLRDALTYWPECPAVATGGYFNLPDNGIDGLADAAKAVYSGKQFEKFNAAAGSRTKLIYEWSNSIPDAQAPSINTDPRVSDAIKAASEGHAANNILAACHFVPLAEWGKYAATDEVGRWTAKCEALAQASAARPLPYAAPPPDPKDAEIAALKERQRQDGDLIHELTKNVEIAGDENEALKAQVAGITDTFNKAQQELNVATAKLSAIRTAGGWT